VKLSHMIACIELRERGQD